MKKKFPKIRDFFLHLSGNYFSCNIPLKPVKIKMKGTLSHFSATHRAIVWYGVTTGEPVSLSYSVIILSVDDGLRRRLLQILERLEMISTKTVLGNFEQSKKSHGDKEPTLYFADLRLLPPALEVSHWLNAHPKIKLLILHPRQDVEQVLAYLQAGAMGHLALEELESDRVKLAVRTLLNDEAYLSPTIAGKILDVIAKGHPDSEIEKEVQD